MVAKQLEDPLVRDAGERHQRLEREARELDELTRI